MVRKRKKKIKKLKRKIKKLKKKNTKKIKKKIKKTKKSKRSTSGELVFKVPKKWSKSAYIDKNQYIPTETPVRERGGSSTWEQPAAL